MKATLLVPVTTGTLMSIENMFFNLMRQENRVGTWESKETQSVWMIYGIQARSQGGGGVGGGGRAPPPVAHPKDFVPPFSNFVPPFSNFVPHFSNFVPPLEYVDDVTRAMSKGGCLWMSKRGVFSNFSEGGWRHADNVQGGGYAWCSTHPSSDPPPTWLAGYGPGIIDGREVRWGD